MNHLSNSSRTEHGIVCGSNLLCDSVDEALVDLDREAVVMAADSESEGPSIRSNPDEPTLASCSSKHQENHRKR